MDLSERVALLEGALRDEHARRAQIDVEVAALRVEVAALKAEKTYSENIIRHANYHADDIMRAARQYANKIIAEASSSVNAVARPTDYTDAHSTDEFGLPLARAKDGGTTSETRKALLGNRCTIRKVYCNDVT